MPRKKVSKKANDSVASAVQQAASKVVSKAAEKPVEPDALTLLKRAVAENPAGVAQMLEDLDLVAKGSRRTVEAAAKRVVDIPKEDLVTHAPAEPEPAVIFKSQSAGFRQRIKPSYRERINDYETRIVDAVFVEFENSTVRLTDPEKIESLRKVIARNKSLGRPPVIVEIKDEIAELLKAGTEVKPLKNQQGVTIDTTAEELVAS